MSAIDELGQARTWFTDAAKLALWDAATKARRAQKVASHERERAYKLYVQADERFDEAAAAAKAALNVLHKALNDEAAES